MQNVRDLEKEEVQEEISDIPEDEIIQEEGNEPVKKESEIEMLLKKKKDDQIAYLLGEIEVLRNQQSVLENRIARYKKLKKA